MSPLSDARVIQVHDPPRKAPVTVSTFCFMIKPPPKDDAIKGSNLNSATPVRQTGAGLRRAVLMIRARAQP